MEYSRILPIAFKIILTKKIILFDFFIINDKISLQKCLIFEEKEPRWTTKLFTKQ
jgi:hypothetical protein